MSALVSKRVSASFRKRAMRAISRRGSAAAADDEEFFHVQRKASIALVKLTGCGDTPALTIRNASKASVT